MLTLKIIFKLFLSRIKHLSRKNLVMKTAKIVSATLKFTNFTYFYVDYSYEKVQYKVLFFSLVLELGIYWHFDLIIKAFILHYIVFKSCLLF